MVVPFAPRLLNVFSVRFAVEVAVAQLLEGLEEFLLGVVELVFDAAIGPVVQQRGVHEYTPFVVMVKRLIEHLESVGGRRHRPRHRCRSTSPRRSCGRTSRVGR